MSLYHVLGITGEPSIGVCIVADVTPKCPETSTRQAHVTHASFFAVEILNI
jgi:hypothetical protein